MKNRIYPYKYNALTYYITHMVTDKVSSRLCCNLSGIPLVGHSLYDEYKNYLRIIL